MFLVKIIILKILLKMKTSITENKFCRICLEHRLHLEQPQNDISL